MYCNHVSPCEDQKLYYCWDSTAEYKEEGAENSMDLTASAGISSGHYHELMPL